MSFAPEPHCPEYRRRPLIARNKPNAFCWVPLNTANVKPLLGNRYEARALAHRMQELDRGAELQSPAAHARRRHIELLRAAVDDTLRPLGSPDGLWKALTSDSETEPAYQPLLVLLLAEDVLATEPDRLPELDALLRHAIDSAGKQGTDNSDLMVRLRLVRAEYDQQERRELLKAARRHVVPGTQAALISAREARRCCLEGRAEEALEAWRGCGPRRHPRRAHR